MNRLRDLVLLFAALWTGVAFADPRVACVYDPVGRAGDYHHMMEELAVAAAGWGVQLQLKAYTDEETAVRDYQAGQCDAVLATGVRLQRFNRFPTTLEAIGALPAYSELKAMVDALARYPSAAARLRAGDHETVGIIPVGAVYLFLHDRKRGTVEGLAGLRIGTMDYDKAAPVMVDRVGAVQIPVDLGSVGPRFNNGDVDVCYMSAGGYRPFELERGLQGGGGILRYPLAQATLQLMVRAPRFPAEFAPKARQHFADHFDAHLALVLAVEKDIPAKLWIETTPAQKAAYDELFLRSRVRLRDEQGAYDGNMLNAMKKLRCSEDASRPECAENLE
ncbi:MAG: putative solute-binding protein [Pseudomonadota bacterium]